MEIEQLKQQIENKTVGDETIIFLWSDSPFVAEQYTNEISKIKNLPIEYVHDIPCTGLFDVQTNLSVYITSELADFTENIHNLIIITKKIGKNVNSEFITKIPKLETWQLIDYTQSCLSGLSEEDSKELSEICKDNIYRLDNEICKIKIFNESSQKFYFNKLKEENQYYDLYDKSIFDFSSAIQNKNIGLLTEIYNHIDVCDIEPLGLVTVLYKNLYNMIKVRLQKFPNEENTGLKSNQIYAIKKASQNYSSEQLLGAFKFVLKLDYLLKSGYLDESILIDYLVCNMLIKW